MHMFHRSCIFCMYGICRICLRSLFSLIFTSPQGHPALREDHRHPAVAGGHHLSHVTNSPGQLQVGVFWDAGPFLQPCSSCEWNQPPWFSWSRLLENYLSLDVFKEPSEPIMHLQPIDQHLTNYIQGLVAFWLQEKWFVGSVIWSRRLILPASFPSSSVALFSCWSTKGHSPAGSRSENMVQHCLCCTSNWGYDGIPIDPSPLNQQVGLTHLCSSCQSWLKSTACCNPDKRVIRISKFFKL